MMVYCIIGVTFLFFRLFVAFSLVLVISSRLCEAAVDGEAGWETRRSSEVSDADVAALHQEHDGVAALM